ncbi:MAG: hypothetical protein O3C28_04875 [Proteobacteria bacterium]|nr:hypothetical protein [Pseudomonadota bacterium]
MPFKAAHCVPVWCAWLILNLPGVAVAEVQDAPINQHDEVKELRLALGALREEYAQRIAALGLFGDRGLFGDSIFIRGHAPSVAQ